MIKQLRQNRGLSQQKLADLCNMNISQIQKLERGTILIENTTFKNALALARALGVEPQDLIKQKEQD